jgi:hypothetical protein
VLLELPERTSMNRLLHRCTLATLVSFGLVTVVGCSAPMATGVVPPAAPPAGDAPAAGAPAAEPGVPGAQPAVQAQAMSFDGTATFRGEPQAGLGLKAYDAFSGQELTVGGAASSNGVALTALTTETSADGTFSLSVTGLGAGQAVTVTGTKGSATFSALVTGEGGYKVAQAGNRRLTLSELSTALAALSDGVLKTFAVSGANGSEAALKLSAQIDGLNAKLAAAFKANPELANAVVNGAELRQREFGLKTLVDIAGGKDALKDIVGQAVAVAAKADASTLAARAIVFAGLGLSLQVTNAKVTLNDDSGRALDATGGSDAVNELTKPRSNGGSGSSAASALYLLDQRIAASRDTVVAAELALGNAQTVVAQIEAPLNSATTMAEDAYDDAVAAEAIANAAYQSAVQAYDTANTSYSSCLALPPMMTMDPSGFPIFTGTQCTAPSTTERDLKLAAYEAAQAATEAADGARVAAALTYAQRTTTHAEAYATLSTANAAYMTANSTLTGLLQERALLTGENTEVQ